MKTLLLICAVILGTITFCQSSSTNIFFNVDSDVMRINDLVKLQKFIQNPQNISLIGFADKTGNADYNLDLSKRRVNHVKDYLISKGYPADKISTDYKGESKAGSKEHFFNRRVEVIYTSENNNIKTFADFKKSLMPETQVFWISTTGDTTIEGKQGTTVTLASSTMQKLDGTVPSGKIKIELTEYTSNAEYFSDNLYTQSGQELIETNGMINIEAFDGDEKLEMQPGSTIKIGFPKTSEKQFTNFNGERLDNGNMNWTNTAIIQDVELVLDGSDKVGLTTGAGSMGRTYPYELFRYGDTLGLEEYFKEQEKIAENESAYYDIIESNQLDYINCDRFLRDGGQLYMTQFKVTIDDPNLNFVAANIVFLDINSIIKMESKPSDLTSKTFEMAIPDKVKVNILAIAQDKENKGVFFYHETVVMEGDYIKKIKLEKSSFDEIKQFLD